MSNKELYIKNQRTIKTLTAITPFIFWGLIALGVILLIVAVRHSFGNLDEVTSLLNSKFYTGEELRANYLYLTNKYGEWVIGSGSTGFTLTFINIKAVFMSGIVIVSAIFSFISFISAFICGKWLFPFLIKKITQKNQDMVNLTILEKEDK